METELNCAVKPAIPLKPRTVSVNGIAITRAAVAREAQNHPSKTPLAALEAAARALVIRELLLQEARRLGINAAPLADDEGRRETADEAMIRAVIEQEVKTPEPHREACHRYYLSNQKRFRSPDLFEVSHILIAASPNDPGARAEARAKAAGILAGLAEAPRFFDSFARSHSDCPSKEAGGNLGQAGPGQTVPEFEKALAQMAPGVVHPELVESRYGFHIVRLERRISGCQLPFEMVEARIAGYLAESVHRTALRQFICVLAGRADIQGVDFAATASPHVQ